MMAFKFRLYPTNLQEKLLLKNFDLCRFTYNKLLEKMNKPGRISRKETQHAIVELKKEFPELSEVYSKTLQYECHRLFANLRALTQLKKNGKKVGKLRFKGREWFKTISYNQSGFRVEQTGKRHGKLELSKIGSIAIRCHRITRGKVKHVILKKAVGKWYVILVTDGEYRKRKGDGTIGLDIGIINFIADSNGNRLSSPLFLKQNLEKIKRAHRELSRKKKGGNNRSKAKQRLAKLYEKVENQRNDFLHKLSTKIVCENNLIFIEDLKINGMIRKNKFWNKRNILDCSWGKFTHMLERKAESAGATILKVNPRNISKICSSCGAIHHAPLSQRTYTCGCGLVMDRDVNSAKNILAQGLGFAKNHKHGSLKQEAALSNATAIHSVAKAFQQNSAE